MAYVPAVLTLPWVAFATYLALRLRPPRELPRKPGAAPRRVSVVVPARNETRSLGRCLRSLAASTHPDFEIVVVDDRSEDDTYRIAASAPAGNARRIAVVRGEPLPPGWVGKPWACAQGARRASGDVLLFTDADTVHAPGLLERALAALEEDEVDAVTVVGRQLLGTFWERIVQPHLFVLLALRYPDLREPFGRERSRDAIANGQFILVTREAYEAVGGHGAVRASVVEDLELARTLCRAGLRLSVRSGEDALATRMYESLAALVDGWTKNVAVGARVSLEGSRLAAVAPAGMALQWVGLWLLPPALLVGSVLGLVGRGVLVWSAAVTGFGTVFWAAAAVRFRTSPIHGLAFPLGAAVAVWIAVRSLLRGSRRIEWKGRRYSLEGGEVAEGGVGPPRARADGP